MSKITYEVITDGNIEECRELCNELMAFQASKAKINPEVLGAMNFDNRMKRSYEAATDKQVIVVKDDGAPVGYVFSTIDNVPPKGEKGPIPPWAPTDVEGLQGFFPDDRDHFPARCGCLSNLYLKEGYQGKGIGSKLFELSMDWMKSFPDIDLVFVYVSNGNDAAMKFYLDHGFVYSHDVFGGFIKAATYSFDK